MNLVKKSFFLSSDPDPGFGLKPGSGSEVPQKPGYLWIRIWIHNTDLQVCYFQTYSSRCIQDKITFTIIPSQNHWSIPSDQDLCKKSVG